jgi:hypothetical protein
MNRFETHVYATVRIKVAGTNFSTDPQVIAEAVADAVCAAPTEWMAPRRGTVNVTGHGPHDVVGVEFADGIYGVLVDEIGDDDRVVREHLFDENCRRTETSFSRELRAKQAYETLLEHPEATDPASKVHLALRLLQALVPDARSEPVSSSNPLHNNAAACIEQADEHDEDQGRESRLKAIAFLKRHGVVANPNGYFSVPNWVDSLTCSRKVFDDALDAAQYLKEQLLNRGELAQYRVSLNETPVDRSTVHFDCAATDTDDAVRQAEAAYPGCVILLTTTLETPSPAFSPAFAGADR